MGHNVFVETGQGGDLQVRFTPSTPRLGKRLVIVAHSDNAATETYGALGLYDFVNAPKTAALYCALAEAGFLCIAGDFGGTQNFGTDPAPARVYATWQDAITKYGVASDACVIACASMGFTTAHHFAREYPGKLAAVYGIAPAVNLTDIYTNNRAGVQATVGTAWGVVYPDPLPAIADPSLNVNIMAGVRGRIAYSTADAAVIPSTVTDYAHASGFSTTVISTTLGHNDSLSGAVSLSNMAKFFVANGA